MVSRFLLAALGGVLLLPSGVLLANESEPKSSESDKKSDSSTSEIEMESEGVDEPEEEDFGLSEEEDFAAELEALEGEEWESEIDLAPSEEGEGTLELELESETPEESETGSKAGWKSSPLRMSMSSGGGYDSNLLRLDNSREENAPAGGNLRLAARLDKGISWGRNVLSFRGRGEGRLILHPDAQNENRALLLGRMQLQRGLRDGAIASMSLGYFDAIPFDVDGLSTQRLERNFRTVDVGGGLALPWEDGQRISLSVWGREYKYKADRNLSWLGLGVGAGYRRDWELSGEVGEEEGLALQLQYRATLRDFDGLAYRNSCASEEMVTPGCFSQTSYGRTDLYHSFVGELSYQGGYILALLYGAEITDSNSFGQDSLRQRVEINLTKELPAEIVLSAQLRVRYHSFLDPLLLAQNQQAQSFVSIDEENRNSMRLHFSRAISEDWTGEFRAALYSNEFATQELAFRRYTGYLGLLYRFEGTEN